MHVLSDLAIDIIDADVDVDTLKQTSTTGIGVKCYVRNERGWGCGGGLWVGSSMMGVWGLQIKSDRRDETKAQEQVD